MSEPSPHPRLILFPGLAADARVYAPQREAFPWLEVPPWLDPLPGESLPGYARRMVADLRVAPGERLFFGGFSFGGVVALEAARHHAAAGVFFIGGALTYRAIAWPFRMACRAARFVPDRLVRPLLTFFPLGLDLVEDLEDWQKDLYVRMSREVDPHWIRWGARALIGWEWSGPLPAPLWEIHGRRDRIIPVDRTTPDHVVPDGRHLISLTHAAEVNAILARHMGVPVPGAAAAAQREAPEPGGPGAVASSLVRPNAADGDVGSLTRRADGDGP